MKSTIKKLIMFSILFVGFFIVAACGKTSAPKEYTVSFNTAGGTAIESVVVRSGEKVTRPETDPTREGYFFVGWYQDNTLRTEFDFDNTIIVRNTTIYAMFTRSYHVTLVANGGETSFTSGEYSVIETAPSISKEGHTFAGWYLDSVFSTPATFPMVVNQRTTLYAKWDLTGYMINFVTNSSQVIEPITRNYGTIIESVTANVSSKEGAISLEGWYFDSELTRKITFPYTVTEIVTMYAKWNMRKVNLIFMDLSLETEDKTITNAGLTNVVVDYGSTIDMNQFEYSKKDYLFRGWYIDDQLSNLAESYVVEPDLSQDVLNIYFYAKFELNSSTVELDANGGNFGVSSTITYQPSSDQIPIYQQINEQKPTRTGYRFLGYYYDNTPISEIAVFQALTLSDSYSLEARWEAIDYVVTLLYDGGATIDTITLRNGESMRIELTGYNIINVTGSQYQGFCLYNTYDRCIDSAYRDYYIVNDDSTSTDREENGQWYRYINLYVIYRVNEYTLTFNANGGSFNNVGSPTVIIELNSVQYGTAFGNVSNKPGMENTFFVGKDFLGWCETNSDDCEIVDNVSFTINANTTFYAKWKVSTYTIGIYESQDSSVIIADDLVYQTKVTIDYLYEYDLGKLVCKNDEVCIYYLGKEYSGGEETYDLYVVYGSTSEIKGFNIRNLNDSQFLGFYTNTNYNIYVSNITMENNQVLYPLFETTKGLVYRLKEDNTYAVSDYTGTSSIINISSRFMGKYVSSIDKEAFWETSAYSIIKEVEIPTTVTSIENDAFIYLWQLESLTIPLSSQMYSLSNLFGSNSQYIISNIYKLSITGTWLNLFDVDILEGFRSLERITEFNLPYSINEITAETYTFLNGLRYLKVFTIASNSTDTQKYYVNINESDNSFEVVVKSTNLKEGTIPIYTSFDPDRATGTINITFLNVDNTILTNSEGTQISVVTKNIGDELPDFNVQEESLTPYREGYTFMGYYLDKELTTPYLYENMKIAFANDYILYAYFLEGVYSFEESNSSYTMTGFSGDTLKTLVIPNYYRGILVKALNFSGYFVNIESLVIPDSVEKGAIDIDFNPHSSFPNLKKITISAKHNIPSIIKSINKNLNNGIEVIITNDGETIDSQTFAGAIDIVLNSITLPSNMVLDIDKYPTMFRDLINVKEYKIEVVGGDRKLYVVQYEGTSASASSSYGLYGLVNINKDEKMTLLRYGINNDSVRSYLYLFTKIDNYNVEAIAHYALYGMANINAIYLKDGATNSQVNVIGDYAFANMANLLTINIDLNVKDIALTAFSDSMSLEAIEVDSNNSVYSSYGGVLFSKNQDKLIYYPANKVVESGIYSIPDPVVEILEYAFILNDNNPLRIRITSNLRTISSLTPTDVLSRINELTTLNNFKNVIGFIVDEGNSNYKSINGSLYSKDEMVLYHYGTLTVTHDAIFSYLIEFIFQDAFDSKEFNSGNSLEIIKILVDNPSDRNIDTLYGFKCDAAEKGELSLEVTENPLMKYMDVRSVGEKSMIYNVYEYSEISFYCPASASDCEFLNTHMTANYRRESFYIKFITGGSLVIEGVEQQVSDPNYQGYNGVVLNESPITESSGVFLGWFTDSSYQNQVSFPYIAYEYGLVQDEIYLYAKFGTLYTVSFNTRGGTSVASISLVESITSSDLPENPTKVGYIFGGWCLDTRCEEELSLPYELRLPITTLYAKWDIMVTFNIGTFVENSNRFNFNTTVSKQVISGSYIQDILGGSYRNYRWFSDSSFINEVSVTNSIYNVTELWGIEYFEISVTYRGQEEIVMANASATIFGICEELFGVNSNLVLVYDEEEKNVASGTRVSKSGKYEIFDKS